MGLLYLRDIFWKPHLEAGIVNLYFKFQNYYESYVKSLPVAAIVPAEILISFCTEFIRVMHIWGGMYPITHLFVVIIYCRKSAVAVRYI
jgi:hypothetical protein